MNTKLYVMGKDWLMTELSMTRAEKEGSISPQTKRGKTKSGEKWDTFQLGVYMDCIRLMHPKLFEHEVIQLNKGK